MPTLDSFSAIVLPSWSVQNKFFITVSRNENLNYSYSNRFYKQVRNLRPFSESPNKRKFQSSQRSRNFPGKPL
ncbi:hypothetical protein LEP1GSC038_1922 [Leptospira weilii str. 2006001855]|uniref:Uncharacterized protein n=1 Tax=Leptospira weilii str. 2006001855 TaxID=996804 RepID=M6FNN0_9LEPT|nr:hypothetical protein LEP1GSC038_1922 [Leptospira weilii str. 2006001855]EMN43871.1 hypothetical protein LEP1GSC086_4547 [Leptospira weilii str. LNT 1234]